MDKEKLQTTSASKKEFAKLTKIDAVCNTIVSLLFLILLALFVVFICDLMKVIQLNSVFKFVSKGEQDNQLKMPFISVAQQEEQNLNDHVLVGQSLNSRTDTTFLQGKHEKQINKPHNDHKQYKFVELNNKLRVLLVHDPKAKTSEAALNVQAGSWQEPNEFPGLAHFCEHMLFVGSNKFPQMGYFDNLISEGGGYSNAYTEPTHTNFYFEVGTSQFYEALDAFSHFFIDPLFNEDAVNKEVNAVNSEYEIDVSGDDWKLMNLFTLLADKTHPASRFSIGNDDTLQKDGVVDALKAFYDNNYSANLMTLVLKSDIPNDQILNWLRKESDFEQIVNKKLQVNSPINKPILNLAQIVKYKVNGDSQSMQLTWQLPGREQYVRTKPIEFIDSFISSSHHGGLKDYLLANQFIVAMETTTFMEADNFVYYLIDMTLTEKGRADAFAISKIVNNYLIKIHEDFFKTNGQATTYLKEQYTEHAELSKLKFRFMEGDSSLDDVSFLAYSLSKHDVDDVLSSSYLFEEFDAGVIKMFLEEMQKVQAQLIFVGDSQFDLSSISQESKKMDKTFLTSNQVENQNQLYHLDYAIKPLDKETLSFISKRDKELIKHFSLPPKNEFIPKHLELASECIKNTENKFILTLLQLEPLEFDTKSQCLKEEKLHSFHAPTMISENQWWKLDNSFEVPQTYSAFEIQPSTKLATPRQQALLHVYSQFLSDKVAEALDQPLNNGYHVDFDVRLNGITIKTYGFSEKIAKFFKKICGCLNPFRNKDKKKQSLLQNEVDSEIKRFQRSKDILKNELKNAYEQKLYQQAAHVYLPLILQNPSFSPQELLNELDTIEIHDMELMIQDIFTQFTQISVVVGSINHDDAIQLQEELKSCPLADQKAHQEINIDTSLISIGSLSGNNIVYAFQSLENTNQDSNGVTLNYYQIGKRTKHTYAIMSFLQGYMNSKAFNYLRTELQLGYVVAMHFKTMACVDSGIVLVQGSKEPPFEVNKHIEAFLAEFGQELENMHEDEFNSIKEGVSDNLKEESKSLLEKGEQLWEHIQNKDLLFDEKQVALRTLRTLKLEVLIKIIIVVKKDVAQFYRKFFLSQERGKLSVQIYGFKNKYYYYKLSRKGMDLNVNSREEFEKLIEEQSIEESVVFNQSEFLHFSADKFNCQFELSSI